MSNKANQNNVIAFSRGELNKIISDHIGMRVIVNDDQWQRVYDSIHSDDEVWVTIEQAVDYAVIQLINPIVDALKQKEEIK